LTPIENRSNLTVLKNTTAKRILFDKDSEGNSNAIANGIEFWSGDSLQLAKPKKEIILSCGAIGSPHLLQVFGIGPKELLEKYEVPIVSDLPGVGGNFQDHLQIRSVYKLKKGTITLNSLANSYIGQIKMGLEYAMYQVFNIIASALAESSFNALSNTVWSLGHGT